MANPEHVAILMQGVEAWNKWRDENPEIEPDLRGQTLRVEDVSEDMVLHIGAKKNIDLRGINFKKTNLGLVEFEGAFLEGAHLERASLIGATFSKCIFSEASLDKAVLVTATFIDSSLESANIKGANIDLITLKNVGVKSIKFNRNTTCRGVRDSDVFGSPSFATYILESDLLEELRASPWYAKIFWPFRLVYDCGLPLGIWAIWALIFSILFAAIYYWGLGPEAFHFDLNNTPPHPNTNLEFTFMTMTYYSVVTFTTLGFGDLTPATTTAAVFVMFEVVLGYIMLGGLISILANKLARRA